MLREKQVLIDIIATQKPESVEQLMAMARIRTSMPNEKIIQLIIELENEKFLNLRTRKAVLQSTFQAQFFTKRSVWYLALLIFTFSTCIAVFGIPDNYFPLVYLRYALSIVFVLFLPGYALIRTLFLSDVPLRVESENMEIVEIAVLSTGASLILTMIIGLVLNFSPWHLTRVPVTLSLLIMTLIFATVALFREHQQPLAVLGKKSS